MMRPANGDRQPKWIRRVASMLQGLARIAEDTVGLDRWESFLEDALERLGLRGLTPAQADSLSKRLNQVLSDLITTSEGQQQALRRRFFVVDCDAVEFAVRNLAAIVAQLESVFDEYSRIVQPRVASSVSHPATGTPSIEAPGASRVPFAPWPIPPGGCGKQAKQLRIMYWHIANSARHIQHSISGPHRDSPFAVRGAIMGLDMLAQWIRAHGDTLRTQK